MVGMGIVGLLIIILDIIVTTFGTMSYVQCTMVVPQAWPHILMLINWILPSSISFAIMLFISQRLHVCWSLLSCRANVRKHYQRRRVPSQHLVLVLPHLVCLSNGVVVENVSDEFPCTPGCMLAQPLPLYPLYFHSVSGKSK